MARNQHQRWTRTERGNSLDMCAPTLGAVGQSNSVAGGENTSGGLRQLGGANSLLTPFYSRLRGGVHLLPCLRMARSVSPLPDPSRTRHPFHGGGPARGAHVAASGCRPVNLTPQISHYVCQDTADRSENHSVKTLSVCGSYANQPTREAHEIVKNSLGEFQNV